LEGFFSFGFFWTFLGGFRAFFFSPCFLRDFQVFFVFLKGLLRAFGGFSCFETFFLIFELFFVFFWIFFPFFFIVFFLGFDFRGFSALFFELLFRWASISAFCGFF
jgi:hypothetical protein